MMIYVAVVETHDEIIGVAQNADDAVKYACRKALSYLRSRHAVSDATNTPEKIAQYFSVSATAVLMDSAAFLHG